MKMKIGVVIAIFLLMFSGAWSLEQKQTRTVNDVVDTKNQQEIMNISNVKSNKNPMLKTKTNKFLPREYIRIQHIKAEQEDQK